MHSFGDPKNPQPVSSFVYDDTLAQYGALRESYKTYESKPLKVVLGKISPD
jgi:hypothetical protein